MMQRFSIVKFIRRFIRHQGGASLIEFAIAFPFLFLMVFGGIELTRYILIHQKVEKGAEVMASIVTQESPAVATPPSGISENELTTNVYPNFNNVLGYFGCCNATPTAAVIVTSIFKRVGGDPGCTTTGDASCLQVMWQNGYLVPGSSSAPEWTSAITGLSATSNGAMANLCTNNYNAAGVLQGRSCAMPGGIKGGMGTAALSPDEQQSINNMLPGENMIVTEVFYQYQPLIEPLLRNVGTTTGLPFWMTPRSLQKRVFARPRSADLLDLPPNFPAVP